MHGLVTPRECLDELIDIANHTPGDHWKAKNFRRVRNYLNTVQFKGRPILDEHMSMAAFDAVVKEAWAKLHAHDPLKKIITDMAAQGNA